MVNNLYFIDFSQRRYFFDSWRSTALLVFSQIHITRNSGQYVFSKYGIIDLISSVHWMFYLSSESLEGILPQRQCSEPGKFSWFLALGGRSINSQSGMNMSFHNISASFSSPSKNNLGPSEARTDSASGVERARISVLSRSTYVLPFGFVCPSPSVASQWRGWTPPWIGFDFNNFRNFLRKAYILDNSRQDNSRQDNSRQDNSRQAGVFPLSSYISSFLYCPQCTCASGHSIPLT